jgi:peptidylprolyl isomerase
MNALVKGKFGLLVLALASALAVVAIACSSDDDEAATATPTTPLVAASPTGDLNDACPDPVATASEPEMKQYDAKPELTIDPSKTYTAVVKTERGDFTMQLRPDLAPEHVNSFVFLAREGFYDGVSFHRVIPGFVAQGGDPTGTGSGGPGYTLPAEFSDEKFVRGTLGMARSSDPNSAGSQFYINFEATPSLDGQYTIFGNVSEGMDVVDCLTARDPSDPSAPPGDKIVSIEISED